MDRLWANVRKTSGCWAWQGAKGPKGYGQIRHDDKRRLTHRVAYELEIGLIPDGMKVLHRCDNPACVKPAHLYLGTIKQNSLDMVVRGRHPAIKLTPAKVRAIRASSISSRGLAAEHGVSVSSIKNVRSGLCWSHVK